MGAYAQSGATTKVGIIHIQNAIISTRDGQKAAKELQDKFAPIGFVVEPGTPDALAQRTKLETAKWAKAIKDAKIEPQ